MALSIDGLRRGDVLSALQVLMQCSLPTRMPRDGDCPQNLNFDLMIEMLGNKWNLAFHMIKCNSNDNKIKTTANIERAYSVSGPILSVLHMDINI